MDWKSDVLYLKSRYILKINLTITLHNKTKKGQYFWKYYKILDIYIMILYMCMDIKYVCVNWYNM